LQFLSDILDTKVLQPKYLQGEAYAAGLSTGLWDSLEEITELWVEGKTVNPDISEEDWRDQKESWQKAIDHSLGWES
jgi:glycerol kinase